MEGTVKRDCGFERCCHAKCGFPVDKLNDGAKKFGEVTGCDLPLTTCQEQMKWFKENLTGELKPSLIIWSGDSVSHDLTHITKEKVIETLETLTQLITETFPDVPLVISIGNHDFEPANY